MLLLVVLSMLVLFMLIGTAFLMSSSQSRDSAKANAKKDRLGNHATKLLDRALLTVLRDTEDPNSAVRYHSLLRDLYGTDSFQAVVYGNAPFNPTIPAQQVTRFSNAVAGTPDQQLGPTRGQFIDIYVRALAFSANDPLTPTINEAAPALTTPDLRHVLKVDRNALGQVQLHTLPMTRGYYNGCLLTVTSGPAAGQSTRILDYEYVADIGPNLTNPTRVTRLFRFRVMAFPRNDGQSLQIDQSPARSPELTDLAGATILVNGRPFSGTGVGYNPLAAAGSPRLNAVQIVPLLNGSGEVGEEIALTPNSRYVFAETVGARTIGALLPLNGVPRDPYPSAITGLTYPIGTFAVLNTTIPPGPPVPSTVLAFKYGLFPGPGGMNEDYDAADFQNMILALQTVTPRARGRVVHPDGSDPDTQPDLLEIDNPNVLNNTGDFLRLDLEDVPLPSLHRPDLVNFWYHRLLNSQWLSDAISDPDDRVRAILQPYDANGLRSPWVPSDQIAAQITALKRKISMRPLREDHPQFNGSNTQSVTANLNGVSPLVVSDQIAVPPWEVVGPWDVDNDNDGVAESIWVDLGDAIQEAEDGTRYKTLYALLVIDLDSRLNVNAHGLADHINPAKLSYVVIPGVYDGNGPNLAGTTGTVAGTTQFSTDQLATGSGYSPAEISLRPVFAAPWANVNGTAFVEGNTIENSNGNNVIDIVGGSDQPLDDFALTLIGRTKFGQEGVPGRYGYRPPSLQPLFQNVTPGLNYQTDTSKAYDRLPERATAMKLFEYPINIQFQTAYGTPPDLLARYPLGLGFDGQPVYEVLYDRNAAPPLSGQPRPLLTDAPIELDLSNRRRRDSWSESFLTPADEFNTSVDRTNTGGPPGLNDDAPFATTDLERVLRAFDADAGTLPSRLWDVVNAFDPIKLMTYDPYRVTGVASAAFGVANPQEPERLAAAQQIAAINRRLVTTDTYSLPVFGGGKLAYLNELGPDGAPGRFGVDDNTSNGPDDATEIGAVGSDDFQAILDKPLSSATLTDIFYYRAFLEMRKSFNRANGQPENAPVAPTDMAILKASLATLAGNQLVQSLLAPELIAGKRMDLNRPFGDGKDNAADGFDSDNDGLFIDATDYNGNGVIDGPDANGNGIIDELEEANDPMDKADGVVDDPLEAGDPFLDIMNAAGAPIPDGKYQPGEPFINLDGSTNAAGDPTYTPPRDQLWGGLGLAESVAFDYTNGVGGLIHPNVATAAAVTPTAQVRNLSSQARQLYARHLYCLMLMLMDEGYVAPIDENDPQIRKYLDTTINNSTAQAVRAAIGAVPDPNPIVNGFDQKARTILLRKLTCRMVAQWAVNCVDSRDADATMTPFEYDEYPWDGWGVPLRNPATPLGSIDTVIPIDGDAATDENLGAVIDWNQVASSTLKVVAGNSPPGVTPPVTGPVPAPLPLDQTRGLVWGAERPELLISETFAFHDRRTEDTNTDWTRGYLSTVLNENRLTTGVSSLDQRLRPRGGLFVEVYNPASPTGQQPTELYSLFDTTTGKFVDRNGDSMVDFQDFMGVELGRMSTYGARQISPTDHRLTAAINPPASTEIKRSPVWRIIVVEENPRYRQLPVDDPFDNFIGPSQPGTRIHTGNPSAHYTSGTGRFFHSADPDSAPFDAQLFLDNEPYVERSFYFTSDNSVRYNSTQNREAMGLVQRPEDRLRLPPQTVINNVAKSVNYFIASDVRAATAPNATNIPDIAIAPIKPGRYAVIGTAGAQYTGYEERDAQMFDANGNLVLSPLKPPRFVTAMSRLLFSSGAVPEPAKRTPDPDHIGSLEKTRRIELLPSPDPDVQQLFVSGNGGVPLFPLPFNNVETIRRDNEVVKLPPNNLGAPYPTAVDQRFRNIFDVDNDGNPDPLLVPPCVAVPVANMSASESLDVYAQRRRQLRTAEQAAYQALTPAQQNTAKSPGDHYWNPLAARGEGAYVTTTQSLVDDPYNEPFDDARELMRNGTTRNYRTLHLQRLADATLPWNPLPTLPNGQPNPQHDAKLPVNLYRTIDTASVDLTAYNGASSMEPSDQSSGTNPGGRIVDTYARFLPETDNKFETRFGAQGRDDNPPHRLNLRSKERGWQQSARTVAGEYALAPRSLWRQEPETRFDPSPTAFPDVLTNNVYTNDMAEWKPLTTPAERETELRKRANDLRIRNTTQIDDDLDAVANGPGALDPEFASLPPLGDANETKAPLRPRKHQFDLVMKHSLGFQNESFGALSTRAEALLRGLPTTAGGYPLRDATLPTNAGITDGKFSRNVPNNSGANMREITATFPWLAHNNRPFVSAEELLQVPAMSSSQMLRHFSTINPNDPTPPAQRPNPYDGTGIAGGAPLSAAERLKRLLVPFGHLLGFFSTSDAPATVAANAAGPILDANGNWQFVGAPHFYRILDYVQVPSRFVGTDDMLTAEIFNDNPSVTNPFDDVAGTNDPRYYFQPPFNKVSRERDPGLVNLNTVTGRRMIDPASGNPRHWSEVFDGIMQRYPIYNSAAGIWYAGDGNLLDPTQPAVPPKDRVVRFGHGGPAWRDVVLSRRGYAQADAAGTLVDKPPTNVPDAMQFGLNNNFPTFFSNPFRSSNAGDMVPLPQMLHYGIDASLLRGHHFNRGPGVWGAPGEDNGDGSVDDTREAGYGGDQLSVNPMTGALIPTFGSAVLRGNYPLFSESYNAPYIDGERNPYFYYQPMTRLGNLVTNRSNVYAVWITVGYFEVEPAPSWSLPATQARFGGDGNATSQATLAALALYNRVYPDGYMLGKELGSDTGDVHRHRGFYIIDRSEPVGFKPGEDLNVERMIRLRRRIE